MSEQPPPYGATETKYPQQGPPAYPSQNAAPYPSYQQQGQQTIMVTQPVTIVHMFRESPLRVKCQFCNADVVTSIYYENGTLVWLACFFIFLFFPLGCCLIPFCMDNMKDVVHRCPSCHQQVGRYNRM
ncbi:hypothetical protein ACF0H5_006918 [Mactra antiquata]